MSLFGIHFLVIDRELINTGWGHPVAKTLWPIGTTHAGTRTSNNAAYQNQKVDGNDSTYSKLLVSP
ncbi:hypothetical protein IMPERIA89_240105 [Imperialibacter sp. 89]|nr:hypothetical protein IMPERIA89_240105 [Imperialibacter sp. 89]CAD5272485.1 hypothetical protein IMPERIA75_390105 [Imperialibacter sp. 75]